MINQVHPGTPARPAPARSRRRHWRRWLLVVLLAIVGLLFAAVWAYITSVYIWPRVF